ncbi:chloride channel protein [Frateuria sp.]|uniref:chloride channel protein n=1 Tax=Frateuria sp. TaxID=2211372 RepID=UPI003F7E9B9C
MRQSYLTEPLVMLATVLQWLALATLAGALVGTGCSAFLRILFATSDHIYAAPLWVQMAVLPIGGLANGLLLQYGKRLNRTGLKDSVIIAVNDQHGALPWKTLWVKPVATLITLGCGASAGKEGPCSHLGGSIASGLGELLGLNSELRRRMVACGVSAGFASVFGTPIAGALYGVEMLAIGRIRHNFLFPAIVASVTSYEVSRFWGVPYPRIDVSFVGDFTELLFLKTVAIGILCGAVAWVFIELLHGSRRLFTRLRDRLHIPPPLMPAIGGVVLALLILVIPYDYMGLSLPLMDRALQGEPMPYLGFLWKALLVAVTLGSGFYGGLITEQFVMGAVVGGAFAHLFSLQPALGAAVGLVAVVAAASNTPIAAILMGVELLGGDSTLYVAGACIAAYLIVGHRSVYPEQQIAGTKSSWMTARADVLVSEEKVRLSREVVRWWHDRRAGAPPAPTDPPDDKL